MYRTQSLGLIFDEEARTYRPLYKALPLDSVVSSTKPINENRNSANLISPSKIVSHKPYVVKKELISPIIIKHPVAPVEIDARVRSPTYETKFNVVISKPKTSTQSIYGVDSNNPLTNLQQNHGVSIKNNQSPQQIQLIRQVKKKITQYSRISKYQEPQTQILDHNSTQIHTLNHAVHQILDTLKDNSTKQIIENRNNNISQQYLSKINKELINLSLVIEKKNKQIQNLQNELHKQKVLLFSVNQNLKLYSQKLGLEEQYGNQTRRKLREEIDDLKKSYYELLKRVECETASESPSEINQYKSLYEQTQKELEEFKNKTYKESIDTGVFTLKKKEEQ